MKRLMLLMLTAPMLCAFTFFGLFGCGKNDIVSGGTTDKTDYNAPKEIKSKDIADFWITFYLAGEWTSGREDLQYDFTVKKDENGVLTVSEKNLNISARADKDLLASLQKVIDKYDLVKQNGVYRVTAGLAPECQLCAIKVNYTSGEKLYFTTNNNPYEKWEEEMYMAFANWFADKGDRSLIPPEDNS